MTESLSNKFRWLSLIATWAVVCIHSRTDRWAIGVEDYATRIEAHIADFFYFAVPLFFIVSGYMFVHSYEKYGWGGLLRRKFRSLYIPMMIWSVTGLILCLPIRIYAHHNVPTIIDICKLPLMIFRSESVHFWYVRALIILFVIAPLTTYVAKRTWAVAIMMFAALLIPAGSWAALAHVPVTVVFFLIGTQLARVDASLLRGKERVALVVCIVGLVLAFLFKGQITEHYFAVLVEPFFMIGVLWFGYDVVDAKFKVVKFPDRLNVLFFVYCMHLIILCWCGGAIRVALGVASPPARLCGYFVLWMTFWLDLFVGYTVRKRLPRVFVVLSGGR